MPVLDTCQPQIIRALEKENWKVSTSPFLIPLPSRRSRLIADIKASRGDEDIIVAEVKCFERNIPDELYTAIGQYLIYRDLINKMEVIRPLYLAIPTTAYEGIFQEMAMGVIVTNQIKLIVVNLELEEITLWIQ